MSITSDKQRLRDEQINFIETHGGGALIVDPDNQRVLYYPSTGRFYPRKRTLISSRLSGVEELIQFIRRNQ